MTEDTEKDQKEKNKEQEIDEIASGTRYPDSNGLSYSNVSDTSFGVGIDAAGINGNESSRTQDRSLTNNGTGASDREASSRHRSDRGPGGYSGVADDSGLGGSTGVGDDIGMHIEKPLAQE